MANTTNLNLVKPAGTDHALVAQINSNMDIIDSAIGALPSGKSIQGQIDDIDDHVEYFSDDSGLIKTISNQSLNDLKTTGNYFANGCTGQPSGLSSYGFLEVRKAGANAITQTYRPFNTGNFNDWSRIYSSGAWSNWESLSDKIVTKAYSTSDIGITGIIKSWVKAGVAYLRFYDYRPTSESYTLGTLPTAFRPIDLFHGILVNSHDGTCARITITTNGDVSIVGGKTPNFYYGTIVYLVE